MKPFTRSGPFLLGLLTVIPLTNCLGGCQTQNGQASDSKNSPYLEVTLEENKKDNVVLLLRLFNHSQNPLVVEEPKLPVFALRTVIMDTYGRVIPKSPNEGLIIRDIPVNDNTIPSRGTLEKRVSLFDLYYDTALSRRSETDLILFWTYRLQPSGGKALDQVSGFLTIPKL